MKTIKGAFKVWIGTVSFLVFPACVDAAVEDVRTVFLIVLENVNWGEIKGSASAPYLNQTLLPMASHAEQYYTPPSFASSLPDYIWLEAGTNFGIVDSNGPGSHTIPSTNHLVAQLSAAGISWRAYQEDISGTNCPTVSADLYAVYHNPFVYFEDILSNETYCVSHLRPYRELDADLMNGTVARYNFITPNLCHDMHNSVGCATPDRIRNGDDWLSVEIPKIMASPAYQDDGAIFITWDEGTSDGIMGPIGLIVVSPLAKGGGYSNTNHYTHSATLRTMQEIFGVRPFLGDAASSPSLADLFSRELEVTAITFDPAGGTDLSLAGLRPGHTNVLEVSSDLEHWTAWSTNVADASTLVIHDADATNQTTRFYRVRE